MRELASALAAVRARIAAAEAAAGRSPGSARLMVVTKYFPADDLARLIELGEHEFGENREPEAGRKIAEVRGARPDAVFDVDMIGSLQRKKAKTVARWARRVQSVDSLELIEALATAAGHSLEVSERTGALGTLLQVSLDGDPARGGAVESALPALADTVLAHDGVLSLDGLMVIAPLHGEAEAHSAQAAAIAERFRSAYPSAGELSAGMSGDLEQAIVHGSTCVRVGSAIMGSRPLTSQ
ncbi:MAG: alanine racemase [Gordonia sp. (in: high G+C Gram-positive bacteria)]|uniref:alanine racemase n=1 Tax=Gordonia sp. (in: high G+C Gram-positive bacteria) TaxID=84139 RepID=UPI0039E69E9E